MIYIVLQQPNLYMAPVTTTTRKKKKKRLEPYFLPIFKLERRGPTGSRARKLLPLRSHICFAKYWINGKV